MTVKYSEDAVSVTNIDFCDTSVFHIASPTLHLSAAEPYLSILSLAVLLGLLWLIVEPSELRPHFDK